MCYSLWYNAPMMLPAGNIVGALYQKGNKLKVNEGKEMVSVTFVKHFVPRNCIFSSGRVRGLNSYSETILIPCGIMHPGCCRPVAGNILGALYHKL